MNNYKYHIIGRDYILSPEEHQKVSELYKKGTSIIYLRNDTLMINMVFVGAVNETDEMTDGQKEKRDEYLRLPPEQREQTPREKQIAGTISEYIRPVVGRYKGDGWKNCKDCGVAHFIPDKEICLGCLGKKIFAK